MADYLTIQAAVMARRPALGPDPSKHQVMSIWDNLTAEDRAAYLANAPPASEPPPSGPPASGPAGGPDEPLLAKRPDPRPTTPPTPAAAPAADSGPDKD